MESHTDGGIPLGHLCVDCDFGRFGEVSPLVDVHVAHSLAVSQNRDFR